LLDLLHSSSDPRQLAGSVKAADNALEQERKAHRKALDRADRAMTESVRIAKEALQRDGRTRA